MTKEELRKRICAKFATAKNAANFLGISEVALNFKINGKNKFTKAEQLAFLLKGVEIPSEVVKGEVDNEFNAKIKKIMKRYII